MKDTNRINRKGAFSVSVSISRHHTIKLIIIWFDLICRADQYFYCRQKYNKFTASSNIQAISSCIVCTFDNSSKKGDHQFSIVPYAYCTVIVIVVNLSLCVNKKESKKREILLRLLLNAYCTMHNTQ